MSVILLHVKKKHRKIIYNLLLCFIIICKCPIPDRPYLTDYMACFDANLYYLQALRYEIVSAYLQVYLICLIADIASLFVQIMALYGPAAGITCFTLADIVNKNRKYGAWPVSNWSLYIRILNKTQVSHPGPLGPLVTYKTHIA